MRKAASLWIYKHGMCQIFKVNLVHYTSFFFMLLFTEELPNNFSQALQKEEEKQRPKFDHSYLDSAHHQENIVMAGSSSAVVKQTVIEQVKRPY